MFVEMPDFRRKKEPDKKPLIWGTQGPNFTVDILLQIGCLHLCTTESFLSTPTRNSL